MNVNAQGKKVDWKRILGIAVVLLVAGYEFSLPTLEKVFKRDLPSLTGKQDQQADRPQARRDSGNSNSNDARYDANLPSGKSNSSPADSRSSTKSSQTAGKSSGEFLREVGRDRFESPAGLLYTMGPRREHRIDHVMRHGRDMPDRPVHSVFDGDKNQILALIDEAYELVKAGSSQVRSSNSRGNDEHLVSMNRKVGYEGGQKGKRKGYPTLRSVKLILDGNRVITAFPNR